MLPFKTQNVTAYSATLQTIKTKFYGMKKLKLLFGILIGLTILSCSSDDDNTQNAENELVGIWVRIDSNETFEERYTFNSDETGNVYFLDGSFSNSTDFNWTTENNILTLSNDEPEPNPGSFMTTFSFNSNGQLVLFNDSDLTYNKIE